MPIPPQDPEWKQRPFVAGVPADPLRFWRFVRSDPPTAADFMPDSEIRRRIPTEDNCSYRGFSAFTEEEAARTRALDVNERLNETGDLPFTHLALFALWPKKRHACAWVGPEEEHWAVWAPAGEFPGSSRLLGVFPI